MVQNVNSDFHFEFFRESMLGQYKPEQPLLIPSIHNQCPEPRQIALAAEPVQIQGPPEPSFKCEWSNCSEKYRTLKDLVIHVNRHISTDFQPTKCQWSRCWNVNRFEQEQKLVG